MTRHKIMTMASVVVACTALAFGATAWACTEFTSLVAPKASSPLAEIEVKGTGQVKPREAEKLVEVRWNDVTGPVVSRATAAEISQGVTVTVPDVPPGIYFVVAVIDGKGIARTSIEVTTGVNGAPVDYRPSQALSDDPADLSTDEGLSSQMVGIALLAGGLVVLLGGVAVAVTRPRVTVPVTAPPGVTEAQKLP